MGALPAVSLVQPSAFKPLPAIARLVARYKPNRKVEISRPAERGLVLVDEIDRLLTGSGARRDLAAAMMEEDLRARAFRLEAFLRLYSPKFSGRFGKALTRVKALEDRLGDLQLRRALTAIAGEKKLPRKALRVLQKDERESATQLRKLVARDWTPDRRRRSQVPALDFVVGRILDADFGSNDDDVAFLRRSLGEQVQGVVTRRWDLGDLQGGIHELRRQLRRLPISFQALGGVVQTDEASNPVEEVSGLVLSPIAQSPFIEMKSPERDHPLIVVSKSLLIANCQVIDLLGRVKDAGEHVDFLGHALQRAGAARNGAARRIARRALGPGHEDAAVFGAARECWRRYSAQGVLAALRAQLVSQ